MRSRQFSACILLVSLLIYATGSETNALPHEYSLTLNEVRCENVVSICVVCRSQFQKQSILQPCVESGGSMRQQDNYLIVAINVATRRCVNILRNSVPTSAIYVEASTHFDIYAKNDGKGVSSTRFMIEEQFELKHFDTILDERQLRCEFHSQRALSNGRKNGRRNAPHVYMHAAALRS